MVEFALLLPILVLFVFGIVEFGRAYSARVSLTSAVREGARAHALSPPSDTDAAFAAKVKERTRSAAYGVDEPNQITVNPGIRCPATPGPDDRAIVTATYDFDYEIPLFGSGTWTLNAKGEMRCGG